MPGLYSMPGSRTLVATFREVEIRLIEAVGVAVWITIVCRVCAGIDAIDISSAATYVLHACQTALSRDTWTQTSWLYMIPNILVYMRYAISPCHVRASM